METKDEEERYFRATHLGSGWLKVLFGALPMVPVVVFSFDLSTEILAFDTIFIFCALVVSTGAFQIYLVNRPLLRGPTLKVLLIISCVELLVFPIGTLVHWGNVQYGFKKLEGGCG
jgi:hypothetical protein